MSKPIKIFRSPFVNTPDGPLILGRHVQEGPITAANNPGQANGTAHQTYRLGLEMRSTMSDLALQLLGYRLTTAEILYHMPDHPRVLQSFVWQQLDLAPRFPRLCQFLDFWVREIDGKLHSVQIASTGVVTPAEFRLSKGEFRLH